AREQERDARALAVGLEDADEVTGFGPIEVDGVRALAPCRRLLRAVLQQQPQRVAQRRGSRGCVSGICGVAFPLADDELCRLAVSTLCGPLDPLAVDVEPAAPRAAAFEEPHPNTS